MRLCHAIGVSRLGTWCQRPVTPTRDLIIGLVVVVCSQAAPIAPALTVGEAVSVTEENQPAGSQTPVRTPAQMDRRRELPEAPFRVAEPVAVLTNLIAGMVGLVLRGLEDAIHPARPGIDRTRLDGPGAGTRALMAAGLTVPVAIAQGSAAVLARLGGVLRPLVEFATERTPLGGPIRAGRRSLLELAERERAAQERRERFSAVVAGRLVELVAAAVIERIDLDAIIARVDLATAIGRVDVDAVVAKVDFDAVVSRLDLDDIVSRVDIERIVSRLDLDAVVARVDLDAVVGRVDLDAIVARIDIDAIAARVDIQAIADRVDTGALTLKVMDEVDFREIIRESSGTMARETVDAVRYQGMNADRLVSRIVDRILLRRDGRNTTLPAQAGRPADGPPVVLDQ